MFNLFVVWILTGVWHGASWNFVCWGLLYFALITFEKLTGLPQRFRSGAARALYQVFTMLCVLGGWVLFRAADLGAAIDYVLSMLAMRGNPVLCDQVIVTFREYWLFLLSSVLCSTAVFKVLSQRLSRSKNGASRLLFGGAATVFYGFCFIWAVSFIILGAHNPFIYFNF